MKQCKFGILGVIVGGIAGVISTVKFLEKRIVRKEKDVYRFHTYYNMLRCWVTVKQKGKSIADYLNDKGYSKIAIYGMGEVGVLFLDELKGSSVQVKYGIDRNADERCADVEIVQPSKDMETVDAIVVSAVFAYDEIKDMLEEMVDCPILALDDLIYEVK